MCLVLTTKGALSSPSYFSFSLNQESSRVECHRTSRGSATHPDYYSEPLTVSSSRIAVPVSTSAVLV